MPKVSKQFWISIQSGHCQFPPVYQISLTTQQLIYQPGKMKTNFLRDVNQATAFLSAAVHRIIIGQINLSRGEC